MPPFPLKVFLNQTLHSSRRSPRGSHLACFCRGSLHREQFCKLLLVSLSWCLKAALACQHCRRAGHAFCKNSPTKSAANGKAELRDSKVIFAAQHYPRQRISVRLGSHHRTQAATSCDMEFSTEDLVAATEITGGFSKRQCSQIPQVATIGSMAESP